MKVPVIDTLPIVDVTVNVVLAKPTLGLPVMVQVVGFMLMPSGSAGDTAQLLNSMIEG